MVRATSIPLFAGLMLVGSILGPGYASAADDPVGYWATEKHESQIKISRCGTDGLCGSIFWMKAPTDAKGNLKLDRENEDESKRKNTLLGLRLINMKADDDHWKGTVYNPLNGKTYSATLKLVNKNEVEVEGCVAYVLCGGQKWTREEPRMAAPAAASTTSASAVHALAPKTSAGETPAPAE